MSNTTNEAIALARRIVGDGCVSHKLVPIYGWGEVSGLARALIAATSPGAQYRAGMERAATICSDEAEVVPCAEDSECYARAASEIRAAIAALPALTTEEQHG